MIDKGFLIQLTNQLYQLTLLFPKKEPLRYKIRELADDILADAIRIMNRGNPTGPIEQECRSVLENLEILDAFFSITKEQNWVSPLKVFTVQEEYIKLIKYISSRIDSHLSFLKTQGKKNTPEERAEETVIALPPSSIREVKEGSEVQDREGLKGSIKEAGINGRQQRILETLQVKERVQVWEVKEVFPEITKRTLRRDFKYLLSQGLIERIGERNNTFYRLQGIGQSV